MMLRASFDKRLIRYKNIAFKSEFLTGLLSFLDKDGSSLKDFSINSGGWGRRPIDAGDWIVSEMFQQPIGKYVPDSLAPYKGSQFIWYARLTPKFKTDQVGILIHPDNGITGTMGCIGIPLDQEQEVLKYLNVVLKNMGRTETVCEVVKNIVA